MVVMDGRRCVAKARYIRLSGGWLLKAYGFQWTDPRARQKQGIGVVCPEYLTVKTKREARRILESL
jgi:hypothetical protein